MKNEYFLLAFASIFLIGLVLGCAGKPTSPAPSQEELYSCNADGDCIPKPGCHPSECINKAYENSFEQPEACTAMFSCSAAYSPEDCSCTNNTCINKNLENKGCGNI
jgi:hypothetical protein